MHEEKMWRLILVVAQDEPTVGGGDLEQLSRREYFLSFWTKIEYF